MFAVNGKAIAELAIKHRLPSAGIVEFAEAGGLIGNGVDLIEAHRRLAHYVDKILKGAKPSDLPVEQATKFELVINAKTAKAIGTAVPQSLLLRANRVIE
jgi:putative ABC transport system substrate-binding protein